MAASYCSKAYLVLFDLHMNYCSRQWSSPGIDFSGMDADGSCPYLWSDS